MLIDKTSTRADETLTPKWLRGLWPLSYLLTLVNGFQSW